MACTFEGDLPQIELRFGDPTATSWVHPSRGTVVVDDAGTHVTVHLGGLTLRGDTDSAVLSLVQPAQWTGARAWRGARVQVVAGAAGLQLRPAPPAGFTPATPWDVPVPCAAVALGVPDVDETPAALLAVGEHVLRDDTGAEVGRFRCSAEAPCIGVAELRSAGDAVFVRTAGPIAVEGWLPAGVVTDEPEFVRTTVHIWSGSPRWQSRAACRETPVTFFQRDHPQRLAGTVVGEVVVARTRGGTFLWEPEVGAVLRLPRAHRDCTPARDAGRSGAGRR